MHATASPAVLYVLHVVLIQPWAPSALVLYRGGGLDGPERSIIFGLLGIILPAWEEAGIQLSLWCDAHRRYRDVKLEYGT